MATGVTCELWAEDERVPDGSTAIDPLNPIALSGLKVSWGRSTTVDQPDVSTCSFEVADLPGGQAFGELLYIGLPVRVTATGTVYPDPSVSTFRDPGFESGPPIYTGDTGIYVSRSTRRVHAGTYATALQAARPGDQARVIFAPGAFVPFGSPPDAWDDIPRTLGGQAWSYGCSIYVPTGMVATIRPVLFDGPYYGASEAMPDAVPLTVTGDGAWHVVSGPVVPTAVGGWIGLQVALYPTGWTWDQAGSTTWDTVGAAVQWDDYSTAYVDDIRVLAPSGGTDSQVLVFAGRITDLVAVYDDAPQAPVIRATCADFTADLDNIDVGDEPWLVEPLATRFTRILSLTGLPITATIDASVASTLVTWRDTDRQPATGLLAELATSVDAVMWSAVHQVSGAYLDVEDPSNRPPARTLVLSGGVIVTVPSTAGLELSACDVLRDPVTWREDVGDVSTRVAVGWKFQTTADGSPATEDRTYTIIDTDREGYGPGKFGTRRYGITTQLQAEADAAAVARRILDRTVIGWRMSGLSVDETLSGSDIEPDQEVTRLLTLLDGTSRNGLLLRITDLPAWAPPGALASVYLEGGTYVYDDGRWQLDLAVSSALQLSDSAQWDQLTPAWTWNQFDPAITWDGLNGVGV
jgi:hypothetical protein